MNETLPLSPFATVSGNYPAGDVCEILTRRRRRKKNRITEDTAEVMTNNKKNNNSLTSSNEDDVPAVVCVSSLSLTPGFPWSWWGSAVWSDWFLPQLDLDNFSLSFFFLIQRWNNGGKRRPLAELCPLQTNLPAPSFCPSQIGAGREGQTLNLERGLV